jgi:ABC-2 type transport system permease protein
MAADMTRSLLKSIANNTAFVLALFRSQLGASFALRAAFFTSAAFMLLNDLLFLITWWLIMQRFGHVRGWRIEDVMCLYAVSAGGYGICVIVFGGVYDLSRKIQDGELDSFLVQPKNVLFQALASQTRPSGWGDLVAALALFALSGLVSWRSLPWLVIALACSAVTFAACGVVMHSLAFWLGRIHSLSRGLWEFTLNFSLYPPALFDGAMKFILFTLLPAGFISYLPVELIRHPTALALAAAVGGTALYSAFALWLFARGLRHYASGNRFSAKV